MAPLFALICAHLVQPSPIEARLGELDSATNEAGIARNSKGDWINIGALLEDSTADPGARANSLINMAKAAFLKSS